MPDQPPTPSRVEELLRASAQRRRAEFDAAAVGDGGQPAMPAAMRRRLQEEVLSRQSTGATVAAETETKREREPGLPRVGLFTLLFANFWQRFALVAAAVVALIAVPFFWRASHLERVASVGGIAASTSSDARPADSDSAATTDAARPQNPATVASAPAPPPPPAVVLAPSVAATPPAAPMSEPAALADAGEPAATLEPSAAASVAALRALTATKPSVTLAQKDATKTTPADGLVGARAQLRGDAESGLRQSFARNEIAASRAKMEAPGAAATSRRAAGATRDSRAASGNVAAASADDVLSNFRLEQTGDRVRIVDADGSVYSGEIQPLVAAAADAAPATTKPADRRLAAAPMERDAARSVATAPAAKRAAPESQPAPAAAPSGGSARPQTQRSTTDTTVAQSEASPPRQKQEAFAAGRGVAGTDAGAAFSFRASGSNVSLRKPVVFEGTYYPALNPDQAPAADANLELKKKERAASIGSARGGAQSRAATAEDEKSDEGSAVPDAPRVIGRARVAGREVSVDASAVTR